MGFFRRDLIGPELRARLEDEGVLLLEDGLSGSIRTRKFRRPGRYDGSGIRGMIRFAIALTKKRIIVLSSRGKQVDVEWTLPQIDAVKPTVDDTGRLVLAFNVAEFHDDWSGEVELRIKSADPQGVVDLIERTRTDARSGVEFGFQG